MATRNQAVHLIVLAGISILQLISTQVVTFFVSLMTAPLGLFKDDFPKTNPVLFITILGLTYSIGIFGTGWLAMRVHWIKLNPRPISRLIGTLAGAYLPLVIAPLLYKPMEAGNPFFFLAILTSVAGYYFGGSISKK